MIIKVIKIGNSRGVRLPKPILKQCGIKEEIQIDVENNSIIIQAPKVARGGWRTQFQTLAKKGDDVLLISDSLGNEFDNDEWEW